MADLAQKYQDDFEAAVGTARYEGREEGRVEGREEGRVEGREEGRVEGREEGRAEGALKKATAIILNMHHRGESIDKIADIVMESKEDVEKVIREEA
ncbi:hypothetical protein CL176_01075 [Suicoccus acidiformans]|uniref:Essential protein Yae1 N-terminal domain-containing protein n=1 Tax=Suicoccus acidiformans TaxID=2036206 RepID=A0A347WI25_9LACT|nr:hypothetical protein [Suicoccus acidiformans]AXY24732.1 hypothetical protein CL176_01075 [Suicoccus acidiformans]